MTAVQGKDTPAGGVPTVNIERIYSTTVPADELARALANHFRAQEFEAQVFRASGDRTVMQARKESLWRTVLGVAYALTVVFTHGEGQLSIGLGGPRVGRRGDQRGDRAGRGPAGAARDRVWHLEGEPAGQGGLAGDRRAGQRASISRPVSRPVRCLLTHLHPRLSPDGAVDTRTGSMWTGIRRDPGRVAARPRHRRACRQPTSAGLSGFRSGA